MLQQQNRVALEIVGEAESGTLRQLPANRLTALLSNLLSLINWDLTQTSKCTALFVRSAGSRQGSHHY